MWVYGYGSLIWKVDFPFVERVPGCIKGYVRRFWQASHDHRGTPTHPGRVCTLIPYAEWTKVPGDEFRDAEDSVTWGVAYRIPDDKVKAVKAHLDHREKDGYSEVYVDVYAAYDAREPVLRHVLCYVGHTDNESFVGHEPIDELAAVIAGAVGPSGRNDEYLLNLARVMRELAPEAVDHHLFALEEKVERLRRDRLARALVGNGRQEEVNKVKTDHE
ncbi:ChaC-like protein [Catenaria anguillulae PL171]|uniref:glutathione-specific gamma-glutamylcyclotransferase n=1 Tax=Catenaria anguillulae PL171 TaxID=765915 RepID=A0A1Y2H4B1_9FUNG|nr:ChaC-like protein [Catenaria anguillulae PL171]